jgi:ABC-type multidrug transport system fused ATPase/permease subunit
VTEFLPYTHRVLSHRDELRASRVERGSVAVGHVRSLELEDVSYGYQGADDVLHDISFRVEPGEALGIVGPSGSGKTTLLELALRLRTPGAGRYLVNGTNATSLDVGEFSRRVAFVPQVPRLLTGSAVDNIRFLRPGISDEAVRRAARLAHIDDEVEALEQGWETVLSERGRGLSGGQRQRLCLARALAGAPDLLVLDEPTSALDGRSEELFCATLAELVGDMTVLLVAHRVSTLALCERVLVLTDGRIEVVGALEEVRESNAFFRGALDITG